MSDHESSVGSAAIHEIVSLEQIITSADLFTYLQGVDGRLTTNDIFEATPRYYWRYMDEIEIVTRYREKGIIRQTDKAVKAFIASPRDVESTLDFAKTAFFAEHEFQHDPIWEEKVALAKHSEKFDDDASRVLIAVSAPSWSSEERAYFVDNLFEWLYEVMGQSSDELQGTSIDNQHAATLFWGWFTHYRYILLSESGRTQSEPAFYTTLRHEVTSPGHALSPYGEIALAFTDRFMELRKTDVLDQFKGTSELSRLVINGHPSISQELETHVLEAHQELKKIASAKQYEARKMQFWTVDSFVKLLGYMGSMGSENAAKFATLIDKTRGAAGHTTATQLPIATFYKLANDLSRAYGDKISELADLQLNSTVPDDLNIALEAIFYLAHNLGQKPASYEARREHIESMMNIIRATGEAAAYGLTQVEVPVTLKHFRLAFPDLDDDARKVLLAKYSYEHPDEPTRVSGLVFERRAMERSKQQYADHRLFTEGGRLS